ncbi:MAG: NTPase KAP [Algicola sp.]|nr:NTPase KAP [Algicola sp.]
MSRTVTDWSQQLEITDKKDADKVVETFPEDKLGRQKYATFLTKFLAGEGFDRSTEERHNYVLNLNSGWGSGKTYFLRRWAKDLEANYPVVYIDAWKQDYSDDPLMTVVSSMIKQLREQAGKSEDDKKFKAPRKLLGLLKAAAPSMARGLTKRYLGIDPLKIMEEDETAEVGETVEDEKGQDVDMGLAASKMVEQLINEHDAKAVAITNLKENVEKWVAAVIDQNDHQYPAFIFIDELDRCRPSYAVEMLETIKHIFDIPGVVFVVATDTEQLQHAVKAIYGEGFDARVYLSRFFNSRFSLKTPEFEDLLTVHCQTEKLSKEYFEELGVTVWPENDDVKLTLDNITVVLSAFGISVRTAIQITERVIATLSNLEKGMKIDILMLTALLCIREKDDGLYEKIINSKFNRKEGDKDITLSKYLDDRFDFKQKKMKIQFEVVATDIQSLGFQHSYAAGKYEAELQLYCRDIFACYFGYPSNGGLPAMMAMDGRSRIKRTKYHKVNDKLGELAGEFYSYELLEKSASKWLEHIHIKNGLDKVPPNTYKDLVELASAIDWIDEEKK